MSGASRRSRKADIDLTETTQRLLQRTVFMFCECSLKNHSNFQVIWQHRNYHNGPLSEQSRITFGDARP